MKKKNSALYISFLKERKIELKIQLLYYCFFVQKTIIIEYL